MIVTTLLLSIGYNNKRKREYYAQRNQIVKQYMKKITRFFIRLAQWIFLGALILLIFNSFFLKALLSSSFGLYWDTDVSISRAKIDWSLPGLVLSDVKVGNPYGFPRGNMLEISRLEMQFKAGQAFLSEGALKPELLEIYVKKIELMRRVSGHLNLQLLVQPELPRKKSRGIGLAPFQTKIWVDEISEVDSTSPILKKQTFNLTEKVFLMSEKSSFKILSQIFVKQLFQRIGLNEDGNIPALPAPQYYGIAAAVEQEIREHAESQAKQDAAAADFEALSAEAEATQVAVVSKTN